MFKRGLIVPSLTLFLLTIHCRATQVPYMPYQLLICVKAECEKGTPRIRSYIPPTAKGARVWVVVLSCFILQREKREEERWGGGSIYALCRFGQSMPNRSSSEPIPPYLVLI